MINLCLVVIATQFSETKKREMERMRQERARYTSSSTIASSTNNSEPSTCYAEIVKYIAHLWRRGKRRLIKKLRYYKYAIIYICQSRRRTHTLPRERIFLLVDYMFLSFPISNRFRPYLKMYHRIFNAPNSTRFSQFFFYVQPQTQPAVAHISFILTA